MEEKYYFISKNSNIKGFINTKGQKSFLCDNPLLAAKEYILNNHKNFGMCDCEYNIENIDSSVVYMYTVKRFALKNGERINGGYKSRRPFIVSACEEIENIYAYIYENDSCHK